MGMLYKTSFWALNWQKNADPGGFRFLWIWGPIFLLFLKLKQQVQLFINFSLKYDADYFYGPGQCHSET